MSVVELATKLRSGKLKLIDPIGQYIQEGCAHFQILELPLHWPHALKLAALPLHHRDPFDRLLVAQADFEGLTLVTQDPQMRLYGVPVVS